MDDGQWFFDFVTTEDGKNGFLIASLLSNKVLTAGSDGQVTSEVIDLGVNGQLWYRKYSRPFTANEKSYFIIRNYDYDGVGVLTPNFDENVYELISKISLLLGAK